MSVYFHVNFNLDRKRLAGVLGQLIEHPELSEDQIAKTFGFKAPFTKRYKSWLKKCGLIENSSKVILTEFGKVIYKKDVRLEKMPTLWYMHSYLASSEDNAEVWNYFYHTFLQKNKTFTKSDLSEAISMKLMPHDHNHFRKNAPMIKVITKVLINSYISDSGFGPLGILKLENNVFVNQHRDYQYVWNDLESFAKFY